MSECNNCSKCFEQADGTIIKRGERDGVFIYTLPDLTVVSALPAGFSSANEVDCSKFDMAVQPPKSIEVLEEVCDGSQTGVLVHVQQLADGTVTYTNLATGAAYVAGATCELHTSEDTDYLSKDTVMCDEGVDVIRTIIYKDGDITDVVSTTITTLDGTAHTLSGNEVAGSCAGLVSYDYEEACFRNPASADNPTIHGYVQTSTNGATSAVTTKWFDSADAELVKADHVKVKCC